MILSLVAGGNVGIRLSGQNNIVGGAPGNENIVAGNLQQMIVTGTDLQARPTAVLLVGPSTNLLFFRL